MGKRIKFAMPEQSRTHSGQSGNPFFHLLDNALAIRRQLESENLPAQRMQMSFEPLETPLGIAPLIVQTPFSVVVRPYVDTERVDFARFGTEKPWPEECRDLLVLLQERVDAPVVYLSTAFMSAILCHDECVVTLGTRRRPGWTNRNSFSPSAFDALESMSRTGGILVDFVSAFDRRYDPPDEPETGRTTVTWSDIRGKGVGKRVLAMAKRPRERLILLLAVRLYMSPAEISKLNLSQVTQKYGRDFRPRIYLKKRFVRRKDIADALIRYRSRDRKAYWGPKEPMFRTGKTTSSGRPVRMGSKVIEETLERYAKRALKAMPAAPAVKTSPTLPPRPPLFW
ncbi:MAG: hypothetical protein GY807_08130, partial [Gammaproteobacteria bacterium]|nr:hypothetical protein [Gammaproteobacteria bacterium]